MYVMNMADNIMVGRLLGSNALGNYSLAFNIASAPISVLVFSLSTVLFPAYSEITARRPEALGVTFTKTFSLAMLAIVTLGASLSLVASDTVQVLFGDRWSAGGMVLRILALVIPLRGLSLLVSTFFWGLNRPRDVAVGTLVEAVIFLATLYPFIKTFGLRGAAWAAIIAYTFGCLIRLRVLAQIIPGISAKLLQISFFIVAAVAAGLIIAAFSLSFLTTPLARVIVGGLLCTLIPPATMLLFKTDVRRAVIELFS
jgi:O-antigen/teichoic acid export membrane protein